MSTDYSQLARELSLDFGTSIHTKPYIGFFDYYGNILYMDKSLDKYVQLASDFVNNNFKLMSVGDHSIPFSGANLVLFKITSKAVAIIYTLKGFTAQLLSFKNYIPQIAPLFKFNLKDLPEPDHQEILIDVTDDIKEEIDDKKFKVYPVFTEKIGKKDKFSIEEMAVIQHCDGKNDLREVISKSKYDREIVFQLLEKFIDKKKIKYDIKGEPVLCPARVKNITPSDLKLDIVSLKEKEVATLCDGKRTTLELQDALLKNKQLYVEEEDLKDALRSLMKKKYIRMRFCM